MKSKDRKNAAWITVEKCKPYKPVKDENNGSCCSVFGEKTSK